MSKPYPFLPSDKYIAASLGLTDLQYYYFKEEVRKRYLEQPAPAVVAGVDPFTFIVIAALIIQVGLTIVASFFKPKGGGRTAELKSRSRSGETIASADRYAPRVGFDSSQEIAQIGQTIPLVYARRETIDGTTYGGVRIATPLIWSQLQSYGGNQLLRAIFLIGEGPITSIDSRNFAIGSNALGGYLFDGSASDDARISIYFRGNGGRITASDHLLGRPAASDPGAFSPTDIFSLESGPDFSAAAKPTTQTVFGLYSPIGNNLGFKVNPSVRPAVTAQLVPKGDDGDAKVKCDRDIVSLSMREKYKAFFSTRSGLTSGSVSAVGDTCTYQLFKSTDAETDFSVDNDVPNWTIDKSVESNPFSSSYDGQNFQNNSGSVSNSQLRSLLSVASPSYDAGAGTLTSTATFDAVAAATLLSGIKEGRYTIRYRITFIDNDNDKEVEATYDVSVRQDLDPSYALNLSSTNTDPTYIYDSATNTIVKTASGTVSVTGSITTSLGYQLRFSPVSLAITAEVNTSDAHQEKAGDVAAAVSGRQKSWDDAIVIGELYKIGSALAVCASRTDDVFQSDADSNPPGGGKSVTATFRTIRPGTAATYSQSSLEANGKSGTSRKVATNGPHLFKVAIANIATQRECQILELGIRSNLGIRFAGICNFKDTLTFSETDAKACTSKKGKTIRRGDTLKVDIYQSGQLSASENRYSFFRLYYREAGTTNAYTDLGACFGVRGVTQQNTFNAFRIQFSSKKRWEIRFEPLSGWEIRNNIATGTLYLLDSKLASTVTYTNASVTLSFKGTSVPRSESTFCLSLFQRSSIGIERPDDGNYVDNWGKLAECFIYEEVSATTANGPEHEIVYINEIVDNTTTPLYDNLAIVGVNVRSSFEWSQFSQFSCYVTGGLNNTHLFPEILSDIITNQRYGLGHAVTSAQIDTTSFTTAAQWCQTRRYFYDGVITQRQNIRQWAADVAATMLLIFGEADGKFFLKPAVSFTPVTIKGLFTAGNILENSFNLQYLDTEDRLPIQVSVKYREERSSTSLQNPGLFPVEREILIRESITPETETIETVDLSDYCTSRAHALDAAKFIIRMRRIPTHAIRFKTTVEGVVTSLQPGDYIKFALDTTYYDEFNNGAVTGDGTLISTKPLTNGTYTVVAWNGQASSPVTTETLTVTNNGKTASPTGIVFSVQNQVQQVRTYQIESITPDEDGAFSIECVHMPTNTDGTLQLVSDWDNPSAWVIKE